jgi:hypothetical protein
LFAKNARLAGCKDWDPSISVEKNVVNNLEAFKAFLEVARSQHLDGFVFSVSGNLGAPVISCHFVLSLAAFVWL